MEQYELRSLDNARLDEIAAQWKSYDEDAFAVELATVFAWSREHLKHRDGDGHALELRAESTGHAHAILEMVNSKWGSLTKMLKLWISPELWDPDETTEMRDELLELHAAAFVHVIRHGIDGGVDEVKIYARNNVMLDMLVHLRDVWNVRNSGWTASMAGRWLAIARAK